MSSAQRDIQPLDEFSGETEAADAPFALKQQVAEKLAAHKARRSPRPAAAVAPAAGSSPVRARSARIAAAVAERYANSQSYRAFLAAEAERAIREAEAAADVAALSAHAVAEAQNQLLFELDRLADETPAAGPGPVLAASVPAVEEAVLPSPMQSQPSSFQGQPSGGGLTVRLFQEVRRTPAESVVAPYTHKASEPSLTTKG